MEDALAVDSITMSLPCELLRGCLKSPGVMEAWEGLSTDGTDNLYIKTNMRTVDNTVTFVMSGVSVIYAKRSIRFAISEAKKVECFFEGQEKREEGNKKCTQLIEDCHEFVNDKLDNENVLKHENVSFKQVTDDMMHSPTENIHNFLPLSSDHNCKVLTPADLPETEAAKPRPKKRGRKPKKKISESNEERGSSSILQSPQHTLETQEGKKRYSLRGVKLSSAVMEAVRGKINVEDEDADDLEEEDDSEDYVAFKGDDSEPTVVMENFEGDSLVHAKEKSNGESQTVDDGTEQASDVENSKLKWQASRPSIYRQKKKSNLRGSLKMLKKFKDSCLAKEKSVERKKILAAMGNVYSKERRKRNVQKTAVCKYCEKRFCDFTGVDTHVKKFHMNEKDIEEYLQELVPLKQVTCSACNMTFASRSQFQIHEDREHSQTMSRCTICGKVFKNLQFLRNHIRMIHLNDETHLCHLCSSVFKQAITLKQHIEEVHEQKRNVTCKECGKTFYRQAQLNRHSRIHDTDGKKIVCQVCGRQFNFECNFQRHVRVVHAPRTEKFHCSYCGKGFNQKGTMHAHVLKIHFNLCPFTCSICKVKFMRSKQIEEHMAHVHNDVDFKVVNPREKSCKYNKQNEELFSCPYCQDGFCYKAQLVEHVQTSHSNIFPYQCEYCKHGFFEKVFLARHLAKAHDIVPETGDLQLVEVHSADKHMTVIPVNQAVDMIDIDKSSDINNDLQDAVLTVVPSEHGHTEMDAMSQEEDISTAASVLVEISNEDNTIHYVIQGGENMDMESSNAVVHDIASLLLAAEQSLQENSGSVTLTTVDGSNAVAMETSEVMDAETPSVITITNRASEEMGLDAAEHASNQVAVDSNMEEITVIMKE
ncbi:zinc finger and BTB domain-containing protein 41-like [Haliotis rufescens]|uniref:zinc finger and BTB domain-containing protein 41-like n=1 Tax=Haliotis rufescens TaxID=6454 RepID=UPI00201ED6D7|nr:zinc finger and BTB domain-containing protein 41-like [Haliotis rufescens]